MYYDTNNNTIEKVLDNVLNLLNLNMFCLPIAFNNPIKAGFLYGISCYIWKTHNTNYKQFISYRKKTGF